MIRNIVIAILFGLVLHASDAKVTTHTTPIVSLSAVEMTCPYVNLANTVTIKIVALTDFADPASTRQKSITAANRGCRLKGQLEASEFLSKRCVGWEADVQQCTTVHKVTASHPTETSHTNPTTAETVCKPVRGDCYIEHKLYKCD